MEFLENPKIHTTNLLKYATGSVIDFSAKEESMLVFHVLIANTALKHNANNRFKYMSSYIRIL